MYRTLLPILLSWKEDPFRKPLLLRGARQVGKSYLVERELGPKFDNVVSINFEHRPQFGSLFTEDLDPQRILRGIEALTGKKILPGRTLLFLDELQECPEAISALRYFYEELPELHVIGAGSLLEFTLGRVSFPVGRVRSLRVSPLTFEEFLISIGKQNLRDLIRAHDLVTPFPKALHDEALSLIDLYLILGGMPEVVATWLKTQDLRGAISVQEDILIVLRQDFPKYARHKSTLSNIDLIFMRLATFVGEQITLARIGPNIRAEYTRSVLDLLERALLMRLVRPTLGIPLSGSIQEGNIKPLLLDVGLYSQLSGLDGARWLTLKHEILNAGQLAEQFVGQELLARVEDPRDGVYYWRRDKPGSSAEIDYIVQHGDSLVPIEVKSGAIGTLKSLHIFLDSVKSSAKYGVKVSRANFDRSERVWSIPLYAFWAWLEEGLIKRKILGSEPYK
jgi:hypothetical protein